MFNQNEQIIKLIEMLNWAKIDYKLLECAQKMFNIGMKMENGYEMIKLEDSNLV